MSLTAKLTAFAAVMVLAFFVAAGVGRLVSPSAPPSQGAPTSSHPSESHTSESHR